jgi:hypothetical protein
MATYTHSNAQAPNERTNLSAGQPVIAHAKFTLPAPGLQVGDVIRLTRVPQGAKVMNVMMRADKLDGGGAPAIAFNLGDTANPTRFFAASNIGQAGGVAELAIGAAVKGFEYPTVDTIIATITAAPQTQAQGAALEVFVTVYE